MRKIVLWLKVTSYEDTMKLRLEISGLQLQVTGYCQDVTIL